LTNFNSRLLIGTLYVIITVGALVTGQITAMIYMAVVQVVCLNEFYKIVLKGSLKSRIVPLIVGSLLFALVFANQDSDINLGYFTYWVIPLILLYFVYAVLFQSVDFAKVFAVNIAGWLYISCSLALFLRNGNLIYDGNNEELMPFVGMQILLVFILIWINDTFAYLTGKSLGRHKLAVKISPNKTWEGFAGGTVFTLLAAFVIHYFFPIIPLTNYFTLALIVVVFGTFGDLLQSKLKRDLGIKDSGTFLGGHGGFLDRFDSVLLAGAASYFYLQHFVVM